MHIPEEQEISVLKLQRLKPSNHSYPFIMEIPLGKQRNTTKTLLHWNRKAALHSHLHHEHYNPGIWATPAANVLFEARMLLAVAI